MATRPSDRTAATRAKYLIPGTGVARVCRRFRQIRKWNIPQLRWFVKNYFPDRNKDARRNTKRDREPGQQQRNEETKYYKPRMNTDGRMGRKKRGTRILIGPQSRGDDGGKTGNDVDREAERLPRHAKHAKSNPGKQESRQDVPPLRLLPALMSSKKWRFRTCRRAGR
jgi:hypothetical protein